jgi:hypothetical protein
MVYQVEESVGMGEKILKFLKHPITLMMMGFGFIVILGGAAYGIQQTQKSPPQPIQFPHKLHVGLGVQCLYCHPGPLKQASAGLPTQSKCWACPGQLKKYADVPVEQWPAELQKLSSYVQSNTPIPWVPVAIVPDFVHFNHRPHIAAGLNCENCHGDVGSMMTPPQNPQVMNMGWCLECHRSKAANDPVKLTKLTDCATCHY